MQLAANTRTNHLLVIAPVEEMRLVEEAIKAIDVKQEVSDRPAIRSPRDPVLKPYPLKTADTEVVMDLLNMMVPGIVIHEDAKARRLNIYASPAEHKEIGKIIQEVDAGNRVIVFPLTKLPATAAAGSLKALFATNNKGEPPTIEADDVGRRLLIRGSPDQIDEITTILEGMGETGLAAAEARRGGNERMIVPRNRTADDVLADFESILSDRDNDSIHVIRRSSGSGRSGRPNATSGGGDSTRSDRGMPPSRGGFGPEGGDPRFRRTFNLPAGVSPESVIPGRVRRIDPERPAQNSDRPAAGDPTPAAEAEQPAENPSDGNSQPCGPSAFEQAGEQTVASPPNDD
jgi:hypothetical protein